LILPSICTSQLTNKKHPETFKSKTYFLCKRGKNVEKAPTGIVYECVRCGAKVPSEELEMRGGEIKCIICGYRILKKVKPPVVKRILAK
jgi:DNA-directed RNA polymerase subunit RPC12/RpoP